MPSALPPTPAPLLRALRNALPVLAVSLAVAAASSPSLAQDAAQAPAVDGRALNVDFETGDLTDWTAEGDAFGNGPVEGDAFASGEAVVATMIQALRERRGQEPADLHSGHEGARWISSGAMTGPASQGTLTSAPFEATHPYASFLISGGALESTRAELVRARDGAVIFSTSGDNDLALRPVVADLQEHVGETIFIRLVDEDAGGSTAAYIPENAYAHINFDHFRLHAERPSFPNELDPSGIARLPAWDPVLLEGGSAQEAAQTMTVPDGFRVQLAAAEPDVVNPIAMALDHRGRVWVAEGRTYPVRAPEGEGKDRILIFEDTDGDGAFDVRTVFMEGLNLVSGLELGFGGVWVGAAPYLLYIPIDASGDRPAGPPEALLDGFGYHDTHETLNSFMWGPDGWLYGAHGVFTHSNVGKPGAGDDERSRLNAGVWRYHPTRHVFEVFAYGTSNPWGLDWDAHGQLFLTACVIPHLHHVIPGARMIRQAGEHFNPYVYDDLDPIGDHVHWVGSLGPHAGNRRSGAAGGGHAHAGAMIYQGGSWPETYHGRIFMHNIHGFRANTDILERRGSGYVGRHGEDFLLTHDSWSQMLDLVYGPDGSVHVIDWYDKNQCHHANPESHDHETGRIYRIFHENDEWAPVDLEQLSSVELAALQMHPNDWYVRTARRILQDRGPDEAVHAALRTLFEERPDETRKLRALWALHVTDGLSDAMLTDLLAHENEHVRAWAIHLLAEDKEVPEEAAQAFARMAREDDAALVRLYLASALQRMAPERRWETLEALLGRSEDAEDQNIPLMAWYALEPLASADMGRAMDLALSAKLPRILPFTVSRIAATGSDEALALLSEYLGSLENADQQAVILEGIDAWTEQAAGEQDR